MDDKTGAGDKLVRQKEASGAVLSQIEVDLVRNQLESCDTWDWVKRPSFFVCSANVSTNSTQE